MFKKLIIFLIATQMAFAEIRVQLAIPSDAPKVKELMRSVWFDTYTKFYSAKTVEQVTQLQTVEYLQLQIEDEDTLFLLAKDGDAVVGVATLRQESIDLVQGIGSISTRITVTNELERDYSDLFLIGSRM